MQELFLAGILLGTVLFLYAIFSSGSKKQSGSLPPRQKQVVSINDISVIWAKRKEAVIRLEELAMLWRQVRKTSTEEDVPHFFTDCIREFFEKHINRKPFYTGTVKKIITSLLVLLDTEGAVPSVVSGQNETESKIPKNTYEMLSKVTLAEHTVHVAEEILQIVPYGANLPIALCAALGHDIGKIPKYRKQYYTLGDHPFISVTVLESLDGFRDLVYADDILKAVRDHHLKPKDYIGEVLKEADQRARRRELALVNKNMVLSPDPSSIEHSEPNIAEPNMAEQTLTERTPTKHHVHQTQTQTQTQPSNSYQTFSQTFSSEPDESEKLKECPTEPEKEVIPEIFFNTAESHREREKVQPSELFMSVKGSESASVSPKELELMWFDPNEFLEKLLPHVNRVTSGRWLACSMPDGVVYVQPRLFWMILKEMAQARGVQEVLSADSDDALKRDYLYTILKQIQQHKNAVETSLIREGYFSAPFIVKMKTGESYRVLYIPLKASEAFGVSAGELESRKTGKLKEIEAIVPPFAGED